MLDVPRFGNRWQQNGPNAFLATFTGNNPTIPQNNNRMDGYSYDAACMANPTKRNVNPKTQVHTTNLGHPPSLYTFPRSAVVIFSPPSLCL